MSQAQLAERLGVWLNTVSRRERGKAPITNEAAYALLWVANKVVGEPIESTSQLTTPEA